jgi:O-antigen ligase/tetratricopeptide (TPR) repeat protein
MHPANVLPPEMLAVPRNRWDAAVEVLLGVLLAFMPLAFGAVDAWSELIVIALAAALSTTVLLRAALDRTFSLPWTWAYLPLALFVALIVLQMAPLPARLIAALSPTGVSTRAELLGDADPAAAPAAVSLYAPATAHGLRLVLVGVAVFFAAASTFRTPAQIKRVLLIVFVIGCAEAAVALAQIFTRADKLYGIIDVDNSRLTSGSFINYSNFSQFMNLSIGAGLALLLIRLLEQQSFDPRTGDTARAFGGVRVTDHGSLLAGIILSAIAVFASLSRNGAISMVVAGLVVGTALFAHGALSRRGWVLAALPLGALAVLLIFGFDAIYERLATLRQHNEIASRWEMTLGTLRAWKAYPIWGSGLGTHEYVFPMYDKSEISALAQHADNDYAQLLEETGVIGAACVVTFLAIIGVQIVRLCRGGRTPLSAAAFGLAFGLVAVAIHSASDFGQHVPAVFCLSAVACGLVVQLARLERSGAVTASMEPTSPGRRAVAAALLVGVALGWTWMLRDAYAAHVGEQWWAAALQLEDEIQKDAPSAGDAEYADLLAAAEQAVAAQPQSVAYDYWLNLWRWRAMSRTADPVTGKTILPAGSRAVVARLADELTNVRRICPFYGPPYGLEGQLRLNVLNDRSGESLIEKAVRLAPYDGPTCLIAGELAAREGRVDEAAPLLRRAVALAPEFFSEVAAIMLNDLDQPELARALAGGDYGRLQQLATIAAANEKHADFAAELRQDSEAALRRRTESGDAAADEFAHLASIEAERGNPAAAAELFLRALNLNYNQIDWRLARAECLIAAGDDEQAMREARICLRIHPGDERARKLIEKLSLRVKEP